MRLGIVVIILAILAIVLGGTLLFLNSESPEAKECQDQGGSWVAEEMKCYEVVTHNNDEREAPDAPGLQLVSPKKGDVWKIGSVQAIAWQAININSVSIHVNPTNTNEDKTISVAELVPNTGSFQWAVPADIPAGQYQVRIFGLPEAGDFTAVDITSSVFSISN